MLPLLEALLHASSKVKSVQIIDNDPIDEENFLLKLRCELISGFILQIRIRAIAGTIRYSFQELPSTQRTRLSFRLKEEIFLAPSHSLGLTGQVRTSAVFASLRESQFFRFPSSKIRLKISNIFG
jgi:hypothetical protein